jgi:hypothetical protein
MDECLLELRHRTVTSEQGDTDFVLPSFLILRLSFSVLLRCPLVLTARALDVRPMPLVHGSPLTCASRTCGVSALLQIAGPIFRIESEQLEISQALRCGGHDSLRDLLHTATAALSGSAGANRGDAAIGVVQVRLRPPLFDRACRARRLCEWWRPLCTFVSQP